MAMTKKEKEYVEHLENEVRLKAALRWTDPVEKDFKSGDKDTSGWTFNSYNGEVKQSRSSTVSMYSTRLLALKAMRREMENKYSTALAKVDREIEKESA